MTDWLAYWPVASFLLAVVAIPTAGWAIRTGLASRSDLDQEAQKRALALGEVETRITGRLDRIETEQSELSDRTLRIETEIRHLPTADDIAELKASVVRTETRIEGLLREMQSIGGSLSTIEKSLHGRVGS